MNVHEIIINVQKGVFSQVYLEFVGKDHLSKRVWRNEILYQWFHLLLLMEKYWQVFISLSQQEKNDQIDMKLKSLGITSRRI